MSNGSINEQRVKGTTQSERWHRYWKREYPTSDYDVADAVAQVDRLEREAKGLGPLSISYAEARAVAALHGVRCHCHNPDPVDVAS